VEEVFGLGRPKENLNVVLTEEQQTSFTGWDWTAEDQELPEPDPVKVAKYNKIKKKKDGIRDKKAARLSKSLASSKEEKNGSLTDRSSLVPDDSGLDKSGKD